MPSVCAITAEQWKTVLEQRVDVRATILRLAETGGSEAVDLFLSGLKPAIRELLPLLTSNPNPLPNPLRMV